MWRRQAMAEALAMDGLYSLKPWYAARLRGTRRVLLARGVSPNAVSLAGVGFGVAAGGALLGLRPGPAAAVAVGMFLAARLACANLDGTLARESGRTSRFGSVVNEVGDRAAELAALAGTLVLAPAPVVLAAMLAACAPSWVALAGAAAGERRLQGGPIGKTERAVLLVLLAATGWATAWLLALAAGSLFTAGVRLRRLHALSGSPA
jgi:phosphatidylglycerophosphate synthase